MNRLSSSNCQTVKSNTITNSLNVTLKDVNIEANKIMRKALLKENLKTDRKEREIYVSGPCFPCKDCRKKNQELLRKSSLIDNFVNDERISQAKNHLLVETVVSENSPNEIKEVDFEKKRAIEPCGVSANRTRIAELSISDSTKAQQCPIGIKEACSNEFKDMKVTEDKRNDFPESVRSGSQLESKLIQEKQSVSGTNATESSHEGTLRNDQLESDTLLEMRTFARSPNSRRASGQSKPNYWKQTAPLIERRRESRLSAISNKTTRSSHMRTSADQFALDNISNPLLRESLRKILNPQGYFNDFNHTTGEETTSLVTRENRTIFDEEILLPKIKRRAKYRSSVLEGEGKRSSFTNNSLDKYKKSMKCVRFVGNERSLELISTRCTGIVLTENHPVRMLSIGPEYAVKGLVGQWLKRRSGNAVHGRKEQASVEKQEVYREVQLLKVGLSMRMLAGIV